jgi:hypothetical protein
MTSEKFARDSWRGESASASIPPIAELRERADRFRRKINRRNMLEYVAGGFVIVVIAIVAWLVPVSLLRIGAALLAGGVCIVLLQLNRRGTPLSPAVDGGKLSILEYQRRELVRQRDALSNVAVWYLLPLIPGIAVLMGMPFFDPNWPMGDETMFSMLIRPVFAIVVFVAVYWLNKYAAGKLQDEINEIDALRID